MKIIAIIRNTWNRPVIERRLAAIMARHYG